MVNNANEILFRPSSLGDLMSGTGKGLTVANSLTCKKKLIKIFREIKYNRYYNFSNKYTEKGIKMEEDAITLYSRFKKKYLKKNSVRLQNSFFTGEFDIDRKDHTVDIKCSWSLDTFPHPAVDKVSDGYFYQGYGYMDLTGYKKHIVAYCLVNAPANLILREKEALYYKMNCPDETNEKYLQAKIDIEKNMIYDIEQFKSDNPNFDIDCKEWIYDIPLNERVVEFEINYDENEAQAIKNRLIECRNWMNINLFKTT